MKYLADKFHAPSYPAELRARARVNERMDWFNTGLYRDLGYGLVYPQVLDSYKRGDDQAQRQHLAWSRAKAKHWLEILDRHLLGGKTRFVCGDSAYSRRLHGRMLREPRRRDSTRLLRLSQHHALACRYESSALLEQHSGSFLQHFVGAFKDKTFEGL